ncbi:MAG: InlB B-repeat-containing protein, partial [Clostridia bacterium]|nr:InlB B-repeat-containing protein [Clostridia bacterium]
ENEIYANISTQIEGYTISVNYLNGKVYLNAADKLMLVSEVATLPDAIEKFLTDINLSFDFNSDEIVDTLKEILDSNINPLLIKSLVETENGFVITLFNDLSISIENGAKELFISSSVKGFDISASVVGNDESLVIPSFDDSQYTPVEDVLDLAKVIINSGILQVAEGAFNYFKDGKVALDLNASYADYQVNAKLYADILNAKAFISANLNNQNINIILENNVIYLEYQNIYAKFAIADLPQLLTMVNAEFGTNLPVDLIERVLTAVSNKDMDALIAILTDEFGSDLDFSDVKLDISKIDKTFFENIVVDGNNTIVPIGDKTITFTVVDKMLTAIQFNGFGANVNAQTIEYVENNLSADTESYIDLADFIPTIQNALQIVKSNTISGVINIDMNGTVIPVEINISKEAELYVELKTTVYNGVIEIYYYQNIVYLNLLNQIRLYSDLDTLPDALKELTEGMETLIDPILNLIGITRDTVESIEKGDTTELKLGADKIENKLILTINDMEIVLENNDKQLSISTAFGNIILNASIFGKEELLVKKELNIDDYDPIEEIFRLFNAAKNMSKREDFHLTGYVDLKLFDMALDTIYFEVFIKVVNKNLELIVSFPNIPTIAFVTKGLFENVSDRSLKVYYKDGNVFMHRTETRNKKLYEQCVKTTLDGFFADILNYVQFGFGFTDTIMNQMRKPAEKYRQGETIDLNNVLSGYAIKKTQTQTEYDMTFNLAEIVDNKVLGNLTLHTYIGEAGNGESYLQEMALQVSVLNGLVNISTPKTNGADNKDKLIKVVDYGKNIDANMQELYDYEAGYKFAYDTNMERTAGGEWTVASEKLRTLNFITNCDTTLPNISGVYNSDIALPTLENYQTDDGISHASFTFVGWYTSSNFEEDSLFESDKMPKFDTTLYAKWEEERRYYRTISFITNCNENFDAITDLEGNEIVLPTLSFKQEIAEDGKTVSTYSFEGWFINDENGEIFNNSVMPNTDVILFAKWKLQNVEICNEFKLYDGDELLYSVYLSSGKEIDLAGIDKIKNDTKLYLDANFNDEFTGSLIMPNYNLNLYVRNQYTLSVKSAYGNVCNYTMSVWQGSSINIASQNSYYIDDGTQTKREIFTFGGYNINGIIENDYSAVETRMPNIDYSVECVWDAETKLYYTVNFDLRWYEVYGCTAGAKQHTAAKPIDPIRVLEDTELDLTVYQPTCKGYLTAIKIDPKTFKATSWGTSPWKNGVASNTGKGIKSIVITGDTTLYACWERV